MSVGEVVSKICTSAHEASSGILVRVARSPRLEQCLGYLKASAPGCRSKTIHSVHSLARGPQGDSHKYTVVTSVLHSFGSVVIAHFVPQS